MRFVESEQQALAGSVLSVTHTCVTLDKEFLILASDQKVAEDTFLFFLFQDRVSLCNPDLPGTLKTRLV